jgi:predicted AAA+ superfamily ATPase
MYINRNIEEVLKRRAKNSKCLLLTGPRQVGKSTLLRETYKNVKYYSFDDKILLTTAISDPKLFFKNIPIPSIIDEVQYASDIFPYIKIECDKDNQYGKYYLTGSQQMKLMEKVKESLAGRLSILELQGLSLREIHQVKFNRHFIPTEDYIKEREKFIKPYNNLWQTIHRGSYPELYVTKREWLDFYSSYVRTYLERDISDEIGIKDEITFMKFLTACAARTGQLLNYANIAEEVGVSQVTIKNWISVLKRTGIIYILQPYYSSHLTRAIKTPKLYFRDTGLACYLSRWTNYEALENSAVAGNMFETFVVSEIIKSFTNEGLEYDFNLFYYRGKDKLKLHTSDGLIEKENEIDLVIEENGIIYPIEIKKSANPSLSMTKAFSVLDNVVDKQRGLGVILCQYDQKIYLQDNVVVLPIEYI